MNIHHIFTDCLIVFLHFSIHIENTLDNYNTSASKQQKKNWLAHWYFCTCDALFFQQKKDDDDDGRC